MPMVQDLLVAHEYMNWFKACIECSLSWMPKIPTYKEGATRSDKQRQRTRMILVSPIIVKHLIGIVNFVCVPVCVSPKCQWIHIIFSGASSHSFIPTFTCDSHILICTFLKHSPHLWLQQSDDEPVDPIKDVRAECYKSCPKQQKLYDACVQRITDKKEGDCEAWFIELLTCADKCVAPKIFKLTKE